MYKEEEFKALLNQLQKMMNNQSKIFEKTLEVLDEMFRLLSSTNEATFKVEKKKKERNNRASKSKKDKGIFSYLDWESNTFSTLLKRAFIDLGNRFSITDLLSKLDNKSILGIDKNGNRKLIVTPAEFDNLSNTNKDRYYKQIFYDKNHSPFYLYTEWGRFRETIRGRKKVKIEGSIYKLIRALEPLGIIITQTGGTSYEGLS